MPHGGGGGRESLGFEGGGSKEGEAAALFKSFFSSFSCRGFSCGFGAALLPRGDLDEGPERDDPAATRRRRRRRRKPRREEARRRKDVPPATRRGVVVGVGCLRGRRQTPRRLFFHSEIPHRPVRPGRQALEQGGAPRGGGREAPKVRGAQARGEVVESSRSERSFFASLSFASSSLVSLFPLSFYPLSRSPPLL